MRVKCPNSDIYLDLPNDRMDMKFTCPACKKVHRVTISITTPSENVPAVKKSQPPAMPKKYATGAYAPVVDIPIDADFVLFDGKSEERGIDLGQAAPSVDRKMSERKTEIYRDPPKKPKSDETEPLPPMEAAAAEPKRKEEAKEPEAAEGGDTKKSSPLQEWIAESDPRATESPARAEPAPPSPASDGNAPVADRPKAGSARESVRSAAGGYKESSRRAEPHFREKPARAGGRIAALALALVLLAGAGYLGWQQYEFGTATAALNRHLASADRLSREGNLPAAGNAAHEAREEQRRRAGLRTLENVWNRVAASVGAPELNWTDYRSADRKIDGHLSRERVFNEYSREIDAGNAADAASALERFAAGPHAESDPLLHRVLQERAVASVLEAVGERDGDPLTPEQSFAEGVEIAERLRPILVAPADSALEEGLEESRGLQGRRIREEFALELGEVAAMAGLSDAAAFDRYAALRERARNLPPPLYAMVFDADEPDLVALADEGDVERLEQVVKLSDLMDEARALSRSVLSASEPVEEALEYLADKARDESTPNPTLAREAARRVEAAGLDGDLLLSLREDLFYRLQSENRRGEISPRAMIGWSMIRPAFGDAQVQIDPNTADFSSRSFSLDMVFHGVPLHVAMSETDYEAAVRASSHGYDLNAGWSPLFYKPLSWIAEIARGLREAGVDPALYPEWKVVEGPGGLAAVTPRRGAASDSAYGNADDDRRRLLFLDGQVHPVEDMPLPEGTDAHGEAFREAAKRLHEGIVGDESIPQPIRQALAPVLMGTYLPIDPRDYLDAEFCRRLIEADYLEAFVKPFPAERRADLDAYRKALGKLEAGYDVFAARLGDGKILYATTRLEKAAAPSGASNDQDPDTGERLPDYEWRLVEDESTTFYSPLPARYVYAFTLAEHYPGVHRIRPAGTPELAEVWHATHGKLASFENGANEAEGSPRDWAAAIEADVGGQLPPVYGPPGWNFPLHVLVRNDQGDPILLATTGGVVRSPDFSGFDDPRERRLAEDEWLDHTASVFSTPGELGLIFHQFFRYCSDSPLPEMPNLIGSHFGHLDTHQTVYQSLERRWVGRLIGDCDDLAEFFQVLTGRQGKLSHVMNLPAHAACGYVDKVAADEYRFVVLQTGNVLRFEGETLNDAIEAAYRSFDRSGGETHMTMDAVPIFLRFADEETRTPFILSSRIYADREYAEAMIRVQEHWHQYVFSAAIREMEEMLETDQEVGNIKELGSLYQRVSLYDKSAELRDRELEIVRGDVQATLSVLLEIAQLHIEAKDREKALEALGRMEAVFSGIVDRQDATLFMRVMSFRTLWAMHLAQLGEPARAWEILKYDVEAAKGQRGYVNSDPLLRTLVVLYDKLALNQGGKGKGEFTPRDASVMRNIGREIEAAAARALFKADDYYNLTIMRYYLLGRYAVARDGRDAGIARLLEDGPYATEQKDHTRRTRDIVDEDWAWFRIAPTLYLSYAQEMLNQDEDPELYDPETARRLLECVARAVEKGAGLGSDIAGADDLPKSRLILAFLNNDLALYRSAMAEVKGKDYSSLYDDAALTFGTYSGLVPPDRFGEWIEAFREYFPGKQHYFKVVYRAIDKENYDHALMMARAFAGFFPGEELLVREAEFVEDLVPQLKERRERRLAAGAAGDQGDGNHQN